MKRRTSLLTGLAGSVEEQRMSDFLQASTLLLSGIRPFGASLLAPGATSFCYGPFTFLLRLKDVSLPGYEMGCWPPQRLLQYH